MDEATRSSEVPREVNKSGGAQPNPPSYWYARCEDGTYVVGRGDEEIAWGLAGETARQVVEALINSTHPDKKLA